MGENINNEKIVIDNNNMIIKINNDSEIIIKLISLHTKESIEDMAKRIAETLYPNYRSNT